MEIGVYGLWHLGCVTAACCAAVGHRVVCFDPDQTTARAFGRGQPPIEEPSLADLTAAGIASGRLRCPDEAVQGLGGIRIFWVTFDTPVNDRDEADVAFVRAKLEEIVDAIPRGALVLISSQVPVGFTRSLARDWAGRGLRFAYAPENLRLGKAIEAFSKPARVIIGRDGTADDALLTELFAPMCARLEFMSIESAEMTKHALNAFLATSVAFINEIARLCEKVGADASQVERGLKSDVRIGHQAYLGPGAAFAGGTLARDLRFLCGFGQSLGLGTPLLEGVLASNELHGDWAHQKVQSLLAGGGSVVAVLGLTYTAGTSTLRRSAAVELCRQLAAAGISVRAHDPGVAQLPEDLAAIMHWCVDARAALAGADVAVIATPWAQFRLLGADDFLMAMRKPQVVDPNWFLAKALSDDSRIGYFAVGSMSQ